MVPTWQLGDEVVTLNSRRYGIVVGVDDALKVRVKFEDESELYSTHYATHYESEMNVLRSRLTSLRSFVLTNFRTFVQNNEVKEDWCDPQPPVQPPPSPAPAAAPAAAPAPTPPPGVVPI